MYYPSSENKGADQLRGYREADLRLCLCLCRLLVLVVCLFVLRFNIPVNNFSVMSGHSHHFTSIKQYSRELMGISQGHNMVTYSGDQIQYLY